MKNIPVCYKNEMNLVPMRSFSPVEMDLFFAICSRMREQGQKIITFDFEDLKQLSDYKPTALSRFADDIESVYKKLLGLQFYHSSPDERIGFVLFTQYKISLKNSKVDISVNPDFEYILNELSKEFTKFELGEFTSLISGYSKTAYRMLKQFRKTGYVIFELADFKELFCIPKSYQMSDLDKRVFKPILKELSPIFKNLRVEKIKGPKGRKITHIEFIFQGEDDMLPNGKYRIKKGKKIIEKEPTELTEDEAKKVFPGISKTLSEKLLTEKSVQDDLMKFLEHLEKKAEKIAKEKTKIEGQIEIDV